MKYDYRKETIISAILIVFLMILAYAVWIPFLGFYREDWYTIWNGVARGPQEFIPMYASERPLMGYLYAYLYPLFGNHATLWGIYAFILRLASVFVFFAILRQLWKEQRSLTLLATILFAIYPGFLQQTQPNCFQMHFHGILFALLSIYWMLCSLRVKERWKGMLYRLLALVCTGIYPFTMEYYIGLEGTRLAILWVFLKREEKQKKTITRFLIEWLPYLLVIVTFLAWRVFIFQSNRPTLNLERLSATYSGTPLRNMLRLGVELGRDIIETIFLAWTVPLYNNWYYGDYKIQLFGILFALLGVAISGWLLYKYQKGVEQEEVSIHQTRSNFWDGVLIGVSGTVSALIPVVATLQDVRFIAREDRYSLPASIAAAILLAVLLTSGLRRKIRFWTILALIFSALLTHFQYTRYMIDFWQVQRQVWWQLSWRAPNIKRNTLLMVNLPEPFSFIEGYEIWAAASLMYYPNDDRPRILGELVYQDSVGELAWRGKNTRRYRGVYLNRDFNNPLVVSMPTTTSCLSVFDGEQLEYSSVEEPFVRLAAAYSQPQRILLNENFHKLDETIFGKEPPHTWCYYYQKASYYRQKGDWLEVIRLGEEVTQKNLTPQDVYEWLPFFVAYVMSNQSEKAAIMAQRIRSDRTLTALLCDRWVQTPPESSKEDSSLLRNYLCYAEDRSQN